jgi:stearoyl-CoA desaturase (delta-9 desaturase)
MKIYNAAGYAILLGYILACIAVAPAGIGPWLGLAIGAGYFLFFWFLAGVYLADILHLGIAHRALDFRPGFAKSVTLINNLFGVYVDPTAWVCRHRLHHKYSDHAGDPNKLAEDGFWRTLRLCLFPYRCQENVATDVIFRSWPFRLTSNNAFAAFSFVSSFVALWLIAGDWRFAAVMWAGLRVFALWVNLVQNYWTHTRSFGYRRYDDDHDNAMNIGEWLPVTATFSACLQNNHHHHPGLLRLSHDEREYDFGFLTIRLMKALGLVRATKLGERIPGDVPLPALGF